MKSYQQLFAELKRRKVFKVAGVYGVVAFVLLQVADLLGQGLRLPESFMPFITAFVLLGFPLALILAWAFEVTPEGVQRTEAAGAGEIEAIVAEPAAKRWPAGLLAIVGVAALLAGAWWAGRTTAPGMDGPNATGASNAAEARLAFTPPADDGRPSIAVLPFVNMSADPEQEYFSDGITEEILNVLAKLGGLRVTARTSTFAFKGENVDLRAVGDSLGVRYLIEGSVRKTGDQLRITAQLIDASDGSHLWSESYDRQMQNVFEIQSDIAESVADALTVPLGLEDDERLVAATADLEAYDLYLAGRARMRERGGSLSEAIRLFEAVIARDSNWAPAWAGLAEASEIRLWYVNTDVGEGPPADMMTAALDKAERAARRALELDPGSAPARVALANVLRDRFKWKDAEAAYREALAIDPDYSEAHQQYAELLLVSGRIREAVRFADRAAMLDPAPVRFNILGFTLFADDRDAEAMRAFERGISLDPDQNMIQLRNNLATLHNHARRFDEAFDLLSSVPTLRPQYEPYWSQYLAWMEGGTLEAIPGSARQYLGPAEMVHLGELDRAADLLGEPPQSHWVSSLYVVWLPLYDPIRGRPPVRAYLRDKNLEGVTVQRTPPDERQLPAVLRATSVEATP